MEGKITIVFEGDELCAAYKAAEQQAQAHLDFLESALIQSTDAARRKIQELQDRIDALHAEKLDWESPPIIKRGMCRTITPEDGSGMICEESENFDRESPPAYVPQDWDIVRLKGIPEAEGFEFVIFSTDGGKFPAIAVRLDMKDAYYVENDEIEFIRWG